MKSGSKSQAKSRTKAVMGPIRRKKKPGPDLSQDGYVSTLQVAAMMGVSTLSVQRWFDAGLMAGARLPGGKRMIETAKLKEFFEKQGIKLPAKSGKGKPVVLLVDDEPALVAQMKTYLELSGRWIVQTAANGLEAGAALVQHQPDCIVIDIMLDDQGGSHLVRQIRATKAGASARIIAISGRASAAEIEKIIKVGADAYLTKPFKMKELEEAIAAGFNFVVRRG